MAVRWMSKIMYVDLSSCQQLSPESSQFALNEAQLSSSKTGVHLTQSNELALRRFPRLVIMRSKFSVNLFYIYYVIIISCYDISLPIFLAVFLTLANHMFSLKI